MKKKKTDNYKGFEQGPIRPPSEANSLLIRLTRNCPWNNCTFCRVYKKRKFSLRSVENITRDIDFLQSYIQKIKEIVKPGGFVDNQVINSLYNDFDKKDRGAFNAAINWYASGMKSIFLQDANSLIMKPDDLVSVLEHIKKCFPEVDRITSYARSHTIARIKQDDLQRIADAGLNRIHVGMESGSDIVLKKIKKGADKATHIKAGLKVKQAGMELSEYVMPGLGGIDYSIEHALETASALNSINPDFIRIRTLAVTNGTVLAQEVKSGEFEKPNDAMMAKELRLLIESLDGIDSYIKSDHILNLFETINGKMPEDKEKMIGIIDRFFELEPEKRILYQVGRRMGFFRGPDDMDNSPHLERVKKACTLYGVTPENIDSVIDELMKRFV
ncbi:radical SAM protein [Desulfobacula phenolica]|uniref:Radical SAM superfamily protein n=1 Tax=Desulfobacula phenolica TaxID=90732 RepID=A0A1H2DNE0_9BACT|nr:radical SAM protein [Desulfobacula phenolica]SDT84251.1 Radical SAM superfamily protein [Desulfobacula phenolica]